MKLILFFLCLFTQAHAAAPRHITPIITEMKPEHIEQAKGILYQSIHDQQLIESSCVDDVRAFFIRMHGGKDYEDIDGYYFNNHGTFLVMLQDQQVVGTGAINFLDAEVCEVKRFFVAKELQRQGLGTLLMQQLIEYARKLKYTKMRLEVYHRAKQQAAINFYTKLGFYEISQYREESSCQCWMEKEL